MWITFSGIEDTAVFLEYCETKGVKFLPGQSCDSLEDDNDTTGGLLANTCKRGARLCFADMEFVDIERGAELLIACYREYILDSKN